jgi:hypothetical protein
MTSCRFLLASGLLLAATLLRADEGREGAGRATGTQAQALPEYRRPELVALTWGQLTKSDSGRAKPIAWRPDGSLLDENEVDWICNDLVAWEFPWRTANRNLRPLALVFRIDERAKSPQTLMGSIQIRDQLLSSGSAVPSTRHFLAQTYLTPNRAQLAAWPDEIDVQIKVPVGEPEIVKSFDRLPEGELQIAEGVRWYIDKSRGRSIVRGERKSGFPAAIFEVDEKRADPLSTISYEVRLKDGKILRDEYGTSIDDVGAVMIYVSQGLDESNPIVSGEFKRLRYRLERYEKLPKHLELKPPEVKPAAPGAPVFRAP